MCMRVQLLSCIQLYQQDSNNEHLDKLSKQYSHMFDLCGPMKGCASTHGRHLFMEGDLKYKDNINKVSS